ncbi:phosphatase PAP2 family protein [Paenibacillus piri]|uniref:Phosphatase PAP2 family protein n=2 Tax=Paenibacillus piri TaxID=2547395 RepID=A0A4R5KNY7_9BACL|nr:phosphatase PAP2 family protein [Paenibacillus piri]
MDQFGYLVLGAALMLELLALPLPGEVLMTYTGLLVFQQKLNWALSILTAGTGASIGMTVSYGIGYKLGIPFFEKYGSRIHLGPDRLAATSRWFERYGNKVIIIAYFIPGIRHFTGYFSGITRLRVRTYRLYAYTGAFIWTGTFISLGKIVGPEWEQFHHSITKYLLLAGILAALLLMAFYLFRKYKIKLNDRIVYWLSKAVKKFSSLGPARFLITASFGLFLALFMLMVGLVQDFLANEFGDFDLVTSYVIHSQFDGNWKPWMNRFADLASSPVLLALTVLSLLWVLYKGRDRMLEGSFLLFVYIGGELWEERLRLYFHRMGPENIANTFPSEQTLITIVIFGFAAYLLIRHTGVAWVRTVSIIVVLACSFLVGLSHVYFNLQYPSDALAGYVFGGVWLSMNVLLLELFRIMNS